MVATRSAAAPSLSARQVPEVSPTDLGNTDGHAALNFSHRSSCQIGPDSRDMPLGTNGRSTATREAARERHSGHVRPASSRRACRMHLADLVAPLDTLSEEPKRGRGKGFRPTAGSYIPESPLPSRYRAPTPGICASGRAGCPPFPPRRRSFAAERPMTTRHRPCPHSAGVRPGRRPPLADMSGKAVPAVGPAPKPPSCGFRRCSFIIPPARCTWPSC
jgi:hypothetical protein